MTQKVYPVTVIGGGAAGTQAALRCVLNNDETLFFPGSSKHKKKSRAFWVTKVENMPSLFQYKKGIQEPNDEVYKWIAQESHFKDKFIHKKNLGIEKIQKTSEGFFELEDNKGEKYLTEYIILCTGVMDVQPEINGEISPIFPYANAQIVDYCLRCDGHHVIGKNLSIIGHNSGSVWVGVMLHERYGVPVTLLNNGKQAIYDDEVNKLIRKYSIKVYSQKIVEILGDKKESLLKGYKLEDGSIVESDFTFVSLGMIVYNELAKQLGADVDDRGFVLTDNKGLTNIENLYIAGDLRAGIKKQIYTAWDSAVDCADAINALIRKKKRIL
ncbi:MAG: NAD(P)/FAD-dependent oxidoreductase [Halobacteriovoraceae bacterium]|nr:NAD(P)/FAD-dependent oxidoreductase [Halobacteriovoraceae bacterium]